MVTRIVPLYTTINGLRIKARGPNPPSSFKISYRRKKTAPFIKGAILYTAKIYHLYVTHFSTYTCTLTRLFRFLSVKLKIPFSCWIQRKAPCPVRILNRVFFLTLHFQF